MIHNKNKLILCYICFYICNNIKISEKDYIKIKFYDVCSNCRTSLENHKNKKIQDLEWNLFCQNIE
jgi:Pyruvate/2-oxoacid:ferredoxin oxidoreductase delta subunit